MKHKPRGFLRDADFAHNFIGADAVLTVGNHPDSGKPLIEADRRVFKDGPNLDAEFLLRVLCMALPQPRIFEERNLVRSTMRTGYAIRPAKLGHESEANVGVGEVADSLNKGRRDLCGCFHAAT